MQGDHGRHAADLDFRHCPARPGDGLGAVASGDDNLADQTTLDEGGTLSPST